MNSLATFVRKNIAVFHLQMLFLVLQLCPGFALVLSNRNPSHTVIKSAWQRHSNQFGISCSNGPLRLRGGTMSFLAAYMLLKMGGKETPSKVPCTSALKSIFEILGAAFR